MVTVAARGSNARLISTGATYTPRVRWGRVAEVVGVQATTFLRQYTVKKRKRELTLSRLSSGGEV